MSDLQGEIYFSSMTCLGKNTANILVHQVANVGRRRTRATDLYRMQLERSTSRVLHFIARQQLAESTRNVICGCSIDCNFHL